jgi:hypothetical protein
MKIQKIKIYFAATVLLGATVFTSCKKDEVVSLPPIGGYNSAEEVGASNLLAHWGFEGTDKETKTGAIAATSKNATFTSGKKGQAVSFVAGFLQYNEMAALNTLKSFTVSAWVNVKNNGSNPSSFFTLTRPNEWAGSINLMAETGWFKADKDTMLVKGLFVSKLPTGDSWQDSRNEPSKGGDLAFKGAGKWSHVVITYDGASSLFQVYANGKKISNPEWEQRGTTGNLIAATPSKVVLGAWGTNLPGATADSWQVPMTGLMDEVRVYSKALSAGDINSLYQLEDAGR